MISVVVIGKNEGERLDACLQSVKDALRTLSYELIYVDSHSTDGSLGVAHAHGARCFGLEAKDTTAGLARFAGAREVRGEYLLFLDGDMRLCPGFVEKALAAMASRGYDGVTGQREDVYLREGKEIGRVPNYFGCTAERLAPEFGGALFIRADALARCGGWSVDTVACEEAELHARLQDAGCRVGELPVPMIVHCDAVRDGRGLLGTIFSRRRLGEGQALRCAMALGKGRAYLRKEQEKFLFYVCDWFCILLLLGFGALGIASCCFVQMVQLGYLLGGRRPRAFISQKLFFFALPIGLCAYKKRSRESFAA